MTLKTNEKTLTIGENSEIEEIGKFRKFLKRIRLTRKNFGWWFLSFFIFLLLLGAVNTLFDSEAHYFGPFIWFLNLFLLPFGTSLEAMDYRYPIILRGLANGAVLSFNVSIISVLIGFFLAALLAVLLVNKSKVYGLKILAQGYVDFFRSTPLLVQILMFYFGLAALFPGFSSLLQNLGLSYEITAGTMALAANTAAYQAEIIRGGILAIPTGQTEAARALGLTTGQTMRYVILPQTIRMVVPPLTNEIINVLLNSSLLSAVGVLELTKKSQSLQSYYFLWQVFFIAAIYYFVIAFSLSKLTKRLEVKFRIPGLGVSYD
ncbi:MAG: amino acid ABC transporter permease [Promethearchaeota archaeon]